MTEVTALEEANKENENIITSQGKEKDTGQGRGGTLGGKLGKKTSGNNKGPNEKWAGKTKAQTHQKAGTKKGTNRPTRGLVFGPERGEVERSASGKRLRLENSNEGRLGGAFVSPRDGNGGGDGGMPLDLASVQSESFQVATSGGASLEFENGAKRGEERVGFSIV